MAKFAINMFIVIILYLSLPQTICFDPPGIITSVFSSRKRIQESIYSEGILTSVAGIRSSLQCAKLCRGCSSFSYNQVTGICTSYSDQLCAVKNETISGVIVFFNRIELSGKRGYIVANCDLMLHSDKFPEYQISGGVFKTLGTTGLTACQRACLERARCHSIGFNRNTLNCYLGSNTDSKVYTGNRNDVYIEPDWTKTLPESLGPCRTRQCSKTEQCVFLWNGNHTCISELIPVDLTVVLESSTEITTEEFQTMVNCTQRLLPHLYDVRLAVICFSGPTNVKFQLNEYGNVSSQIKALQELSCGGDGAKNLKNAIMKAHEKVYNGSTGDRPEGRDVILIMIKPDTIWTHNLAVEAASVRAAGIHIIAVGQTSIGVGNDILDMVVSEPLEENKLTVSSLDDLIGIGTEIAEAINLGLL